MACLPTMTAAPQHHVACFGNIIRRSSFRLHKAGSSMMHDNSQDDMHFECRPLGVRDIVVQVIELNTAQAALTFTAKRQMTSRAPSNFRQLVLAVVRQIP